MKLKIEITMDNAAFDGADGTVSSEEPTRILQFFIECIKESRLSPGYIWKLRDVNRNDVGQARVTR